MSMRLGIVSVLLCGLAALAADRPAEPKGTKLDFRLTDPRDGRAISFGHLKERKALVVVFLGTECPLSNAFLPVLAALHRTYTERGVVFVGVNANRQDTPERVATHAREHAVPFAVVKDP